MLKTPGGSSEPGLRNAVICIIYNKIIYYVSGKFDLSFLCKTNYLQYKLMIVYI